MRIIYNIGIRIYAFAVRLASTINPKAKLFVKGRKNILTELENTLSTSKNTVWVHCSSLGEFEQARPIIIDYRLSNPTHRILLTFFSPSGYEIRKNTQLANWVFYLPLDSASNAREFVRIVNPIKAIFIKYDFWFNYMSELRANKIPLYSVSTKFRSEQSFFKYKWFAKQLKNISHFFVQDKISAQLLKKIGFTNVTISGDTRFDTVLINSQKTTGFPLIKIFTEDRDTIICGSTWPKDERLLINYIKKNPQYNYIIAPHEMRHILNLQKKTNAILYSNTNVNNIKNCKVLIIDNIGVLSQIYKYCKIAYIGGGFGVGIHNLLEAVAFGLPVIFGPNYKKFNEAQEIIKLKAGISISNYVELDSAIKKFRKFNNSIAYNYIQNNSGATKKILSAL